MDECLSQDCFTTDEAYQKYILQGVSRTFALTIPQLPSPLAHVVSNAYLLCRIADTIEDEPTLEVDKKREFAEEFAYVVAAQAPASQFAAELSCRLSSSTLAAERDLVYNTARVIRITHGFNETQRAALERCVRIMSAGMAEFQQNTTLAGLADLRQLNRYCYYVAGVVGEMLTELFCDYLEDMRAQRAHLSKLAVSFGQGLQMTNILKDIWEDWRRGACWLPRDIFQRAGFDLRDLSPNHYSQAFGAGLRELIGIARAHLLNALTYTLLFPRTEKGIRRFCLWALGMAILTLRKVSQHLDFSSGQQVKISRRAVKGTVLVTNLAVSNDLVLRRIFDLYTRGLPAPSSPAGMPVLGQY
ncbi:MAG: phytoene/squalene synthase family protein [Gammaproteobacteria bacterium]